MTAGSISNKYKLKVNKRNPRKECETCSNLWLKYQRHSTSFWCSLMLTLNIFHKLLWYFRCWLWASKYRLGQFPAGIYLFKVNNRNQWLKFLLSLKISTNISHKITISLSDHRDVFRTPMNIYNATFLRK